MQYAELFEPILKGKLKALREFAAKVVPIIGLNFLINPGVWVNAQTNDNNVNVSIMGYYIDQIEVT